MVEAVLRWRELMVEAACAVAGADGGGGLCDGAPPMSASG
jgi:hypothetical protein